VERGLFVGTSIGAVERVVVGLGAELDVRVRWHGEELDRLLDAAHAAMVERLIEILVPLGWQCAAEVTFVIGGGRGSVDVLAWHERSGRLLVVETKSVVPDLQQMLGAFDRKVRLAPTIAARRGWRSTGVAKAIALAGTPTNRRRAEQFAATLRSVLPSDGATMRRWLADPVGPSPAAVWFLSDGHVMTTIRRRRVRPGGKSGGLVGAGRASSVREAAAEASHGPSGKREGLRGG
jgi:hypothetical protein